MKNQFTINRAKHDTYFTCISNYLIKDTRLTVIEKGIMIMILSNNDTKFILNMKQIQKESGIGEDRFWKASKKLQELGYLEKIYLNGGCHWIATENTTLENNTLENNTLENNTLENNTLENNTLENAVIINNNINKEQIEERKNLINNNNNKGNFENFSSEEEDLDLGSEFIKNNNSINDLQFVLDNSEQFNLIYKENNWNKFDISNYTNSLIASNVHEFIKSDKNEQRNLLIANPSLALQINLIKFAKELVNSNLITLNIINEFNHQSLNY